MKFDFKAAFEKIKIAISGEEPTMAEMESAATKINEVVSNNEKLATDFKAEQDAHGITKQSLTEIQTELSNVKKELATANENLKKLPAASTSSTVVDASTNNVHADADEPWFNTPWNVAIREKAARLKNVNISATEE
jgi:septal ring factor EnvC (AmiA/AmiB activator)